MEIVDNLIYRKAVRPLAMALLDNGRLGRFNEYWCNEHAMEFVIDVVIPFAKRHLRLLDIDHCPGAYCIMGSSSGGLMALYTALRAPRIFGNVITQSGVFVEDWSDQFRGVWKNVLRQAAKRRKIASVFLNSGQTNRLFKLMAENKIPDVRIWMDVGI